MQIKEIMTTDVKTCNPDITSHEAAKIMVKDGIGSLIVTKEDTRVLGIVTDGDLIRDVVAKGLDPKQVKVSEIMTKEVVMISSETSVQEAVDIMIEKDVRKLPVLEGNRLIGIISMMDMCKTQPKLVEKFSAMFSTGGGKSIAG